MHQHPDAQLAPHEPASLGEEDGAAVGREVSVLRRHAGGLHGELDEGGRRVLGRAPEDERDDRDDGRDERENGGETAREE